MPDFEDDAAWMAYVATITDPTELLEELVKLDTDVDGVGDPYYRDLYMAVIDRAREVTSA